MSNKNWLRFFDIRILSFAGIFKGKKADIVYPEGFKPKDDIDPANGIVVFFPPELRYVEAAGDQGTGKTSFLSLVREFCGHMALDRFINRQDSDKKYEGYINGVDGKRYKVKATRTQFDLWEVATDENGEPQVDSRGVEMLRTIRKPKDALKHLVGPAGISPLEVAAMKPADQVKWIRSVVRLDQEQFDFELKLNKDITDTYGNRRKANNRTKELQTVLTNNEYFKQHEQYAEYFATTSFDNLEQEIRAIHNRHSEYQEQQRLMYELSDRKLAGDRTIKSLENQIAELQRQLAEEKKAWVANNKKIDEVQMYLEANKGVVAEFEQSNQKIKEASDFKVRKMEFEQMVAQLEEYNHVSDEATRLDGRLAELRKLKVEFDASVTPAVEGLTVRTPDEEDSREGIFYNDMPLELLCESDQWKWFAELCRVCNIHVLYIENITSIGTDTIQKFNEFIEGGGYVFATKMERQQKDLRITFNTKIPV